MQRTNETLIAMIGAAGCTARLQALRRTNRQGAKCLPEHQPDMDFQRILHFSVNPFASKHILTIDVNYIDVNISA
jgi:hypothetical protein